MTDRPDITTRRAVELLAAADAVAAAERPEPKPRLGKIVKDPMAVAVMLLAVAVVALSWIVSVQGRDTASRSVRNNSSLQILTNTVRDLSQQVDSLERQSVAKDQVNAELARQNRELRNLLIAHGINPIPSVGPAPTSAPTPGATSSRSASPTATSLPKAPAPTATARPASKQPLAQPSPSPTASNRQASSPAPTPAPSPSPTICTLANPLTGKCLL